MSEILVPGFGICMQGLELPFTRALAEKAKPGLTFNYVEIGVCHCRTMAAVESVLKQTQAKWTITGVDPWSEAPKNFYGRFFSTFRKVPQEQVRLINKTREEAFKTWAMPIHFCLIDGCHSKKCAMEDFLDVEKWVVTGGLALFHDFGEVSVGAGFSDHCKTLPMDVRGGVKELGLFDDVRPGWKKLPDWLGKAPPEGADMGVFERVG